ncbi:hypothetical protein EVAR_48486_1 [Eumeta japonica]|uniref:Uncharacterized protein n=1 Tax=Eumeta variegata TaxID=151549 RepID=A0A4C1XGK3_EUMVA|nr:hypothetical protein EVAR_48486_1 [Eumeta japonica]
MKWKDSRIPLCYREIRSSFSFVCYSLAESTPANFAPDVFCHLADYDDSEIHIEKVRLLATFTRVAVVDGTGGAPRLGSGAVSSSARPPVRRPAFETFHASNFTVKVFDVGADSSFAIYLTFSLPPAQRMSVAAPAEWAARVSSPRLSPTRRPLERSYVLTTASVDNTTKRWEPGSRPMLARGLRPGTAEPSIRLEPEMCEGDRQRVYDRAPRILSKSLPVYRGAGSSRRRPYTGNAASRAVTNREECAQVQI